MCSADVGRKEKPKGREKIASEPKGPNHNCSQVGMIQMPKLCRPLPAGKEKPRGGEQTAKDPKARLYVFQGAGAIHISKPMTVNIGREGKAKGR